MSFRLFKYRFLWLFILLVGNECVHAQQQEVEVMELTDKESIPYWEDSAYIAYEKEEFIEFDTSIKEEAVQIQETYNSEEFNYDEEINKGLSFWDRMWRKIDRWINQFFDRIFPNWNVSMQKIIEYSLIGIGAFAILFILYRLLFSGNKVFIREQNEHEPGDVEYVERNLEKVDVEHYFNQAVKEEKWNLAIRYLHLQNLKIMAKKELIEWDYRKTNREFLQEIKDDKLRQKFEKTTTVFDYVWFGDFEMTQQKFEALKVDFMDLKKEVS